MDVFRNVAVFVIGFFAFSFNWSLHADSRAVLLYTTEAPDKWSLDCHYYTPLRMIKVRVPIQIHCAPEIPADK